MDHLLINKATETEKMCATKKHIVKHIVKQGKYSAFVRNIRAHVLLIAGLAASQQRCFGQSALWRTAALPEPCEIYIYYVDRRPVM